MDEKHRLRAQLRQIRRQHADALPKQVRALVLHRPPGAVAAMVPEGAAIGLYHPTDGEAPALGYARWFHDRGHPIALPWFADRASPMTFRHWADPYDDALLAPGPWRALQPAATAPEATPDVLFVPVLGFTADGARLGQGGGHYDRWLAAHPQAMALGLAWDCQLCDVLPMESHDRPLAAVITPTRLYAPEQED